MTIDWSRLRTLTARQLVAALLRDGFVLDRQSGSHRQYRHPDDRRLVSLSFHRPGQTFRRGTLRRMVQDQAKWTTADLVRLGLLR